MARKLGVPSLLLARVGRDRLADVALEGPRRAGVDVSKVVHAEDDETGAGLVIVGPDGEKTMLFAESASARWTESEISGVREVLELADARSILVVDLDVPPALVREALHGARTRGLRIVLDPSRPARMAAELYSHCDSMTPDASEAAALTGIDIQGVDTAQRAGALLCERGVRRALSSSNAAAVSSSKDCASTMSCRRPSTLSTRLAPATPLPLSSPVPRSKA